MCRGRYLTLRWRIIKPYCVCGPVKLDTECLMNESYQVAELLLSCVQAVGVVASLLFAGWQLSRNRAILERDSYERLSREYQALLWVVVDHPHLDRVWERLSDVDTEKFSTGLSGDQLWGVWHSMSREEKDCYRYTRSALEIFERAWQLRDAKHIDSETWGKWTEWMVSWSGSAYFPYVYAEVKHQFIERFTHELDRRAAPELLLENPHSRRAKATVSAQGEPLSFH